MYIAHEIAREILSNLEHPTRVYYTYIDGVFKNQTERIYTVEEFDEITTAYNVWFKVSDGFLPIGRA